MSKGILTSDNFNLDSAESTGGASGSKKVKGSDGLFYQLKFPIKNATFFRKTKAHSLDHENFGEFIAAAVSKELAKDPNDDTQLVPEVFLVHDKTNNTVGIASKYLQNVQGNMDDFAKSPDKEEITQKLNDVQGQLEILDRSGLLADDLKTRQLELRKQEQEYQKQLEKLKKVKGHAYVDMKSSTQKVKKLGLAGEDNQQMRKDLANAIALSVLSGDHDVNPGNMLVVKDSKGRSRIARIDFGHAFNDLLRGGLAFGGGVRNKNNQILDFLNRETLSHANPTKRGSKLWRDYTNLVPSEELAEAFKELSKKDFKPGLDQAKGSFQQLLDSLKVPELSEAEKWDKKKVKEHNKQVKANKKLAEHIKKSLISINNNISDKKISSKSTPQEALDNTFANLETVYKRRQEEMAKTAKIMELQLGVDKALKNAPVDLQAIAALKKEYEELTVKDKKGKDQGITWIKSDKKKHPVKGTLEKYIKQRCKELQISKKDIKTLIAGVKEQPQKSSGAERARPTLASEMEGVKRTLGSFVAHPSSASAGVRKGSSRDVGTSRS